MSETTLPLPADPLTGPAGADVESTPTTFRAFAERWLASRRDLTPSTRQGYRSLLASQLVPAFGDLALTALDVQNVNAWLQSREGQLKPKSVRNALGFLSRILEGARASGDLEVNRLSRSRALRRPPPARRPPRVRKAGPPWQPPRRVQPDALPPRAVAWAPKTRYYYAWVLGHFAAFQAAHPTLPLLDQMTGFIGTQRTPIMAHHVRRVLKAKYRREVDWQEEIPPVRTYRDEGMLRRGLFTRDGEVARFLATIPRRRDHAMVQLCWTLRRAEVAGLRWTDVDLEAGIVNMLGKGGKRAWTLLAPGAVAALRAYREEEGQPPDTAYIFPGRHGGPMVAHSVGGQVRRLLRRAGVYTRGRGAHAFRRSFATNYLKSNPSDLRGLQALMRHANIATTAGYVFLDPDDLAPRFARAFEPSPETPEGPHDTR